MLKPAVEMAIRCFSANARSQVAHAPEGGACGRGVAAHLAGAGISFRAEARAGLGEGFVDEDAAADHCAIGEVTDAMLKHAGKRDLAIVLLFRGLLFWRELFVRLFRNALARGFANSYKRTVPL